MKIKARDIKGIRKLMKTDSAKANFLFEGINLGMSDEEISFYMNPKYSHEDAYCIFCLLQGGMRVNDIIQYTKSGYSLKQIYTRMLHNPKIK